MPRNRCALLAIALAAACGDERPARPSTRLVTTVLGDGTGGYRSGKPLEAQLWMPMDVTFGPDGRMYVADFGNQRIRAVDLRRGDIEDVAGTGVQGDGPSGPALASALNHPTSVSFGPDGGLFIAAWGNNEIKRVDLATGRISDVAGTGKHAYCGDGGPAVAAALDHPASIAFAADGSQFILDQRNQVIRRVDAAGDIHRVAGRCVTVSQCEEGESPAPCASPSNKSACLSGVGACDSVCRPGFAEGSALDILMSQPLGVPNVPGGRLAFGPDGDLYFTDTSNHLVRKIDMASREVSIVAGHLRADEKGGVRGNGAAGGAAVGTDLDTPIDVEIDPDGTLYFADTMNSCVRSVSPDGTLSTVVGVCGTPGFNGDGKPSGDTLLNRPFGLTLYEGSLYVVDTHNHRVRRLVLP